MCTIIRQSVAASGVMLMLFNSVSYLSAGYVLGSI